MIRLYFRFNFMSFHICARLLILSKVSIMRKIKFFISCKLTRKTIVLGIQFSWKYFYETILWKNLRNTISSDNNIMKIGRTISKVNIWLENGTNLSLYCDPRILIFYWYLIIISYLWRGICLIGVLTMDSFYCGLM